MTGKADKSPSLSTQVTSDASRSSNHDNVMARRKFRDLRLHAFHSSRRSPVSPSPFKTQSSVRLESLRSLSFSFQAQQNRSRTIRTVMDRQSKEWEVIYELNFQRRFT